MSPNTSIDPARGTPYADTQADAADNSIERDSEPVPHQFPPRYSSHGAVASHFQAYGGETWIDFLRESGTDHTLNRPLPNIPNTPSELRPQAPSSRYTLPNRPSPPRTDSSSSRSSDRKRRLTTADSPMRRPSSIRMHGNNAGNTIADPIVLDSSQPPLPPLPPLPLPSRSPQQDLAPVRRQSDIVLPRWQPDSEVTQCPVCGRHFTFLFRKHHCRYVLPHVSPLPGMVVRSLKTTKTNVSSPENVEESCALRAHPIASLFHDNSLYTNRRTIF